MSRSAQTYPYILMYHSVDTRTEDPYLVTVDPERFDEQLRWLRRRDRRGVSVSQLLAAWQRGRANGLVGLTFDDGYADFADRVLPALLRHGHTATVFALAGRLGGANGWESAGPRKPLMCQEQLREARRQGMEIGSHGMFHQRLSEVSTAELRSEVVASRELLSELSGAHVTGFCYPYGDVSPAVVKAVRDGGYEYACAIWRCSLSGRHALPRTYVGHRDRGLRLWAKRYRHTWRNLASR